MFLLLNHLEFNYVWKKNIIKFALILYQMSPHNNSFPTSCDIFFKQLSPPTYCQCVPEYGALYWGTCSIAVTTFLKKTISLCQHSSTANGVPARSRTLECTPPPSMLRFWLSCYYTDFIHRDPATVSNLYDSSLMSRSFFALGSY